MVAHGRLTAKATRRTRANLGFFPSGPALLRSARSDGLLQGFQKELLGELRRERKEAAARVIQGLPPVDDGLQEEWKHRLEDINRVWGLLFFLNGARFVVDEALVGKNFQYMHAIYAISRGIPWGKGRSAYIQQSMRPLWAEDAIFIGKQGIVAADEELVRGFLRDGEFVDAPIVQSEIAPVFNARPDFGEISTWAGQVSESVAATNRTAMIKVFDKARDFFDDDKQVGLSPRAIANLLLEDGATTDIHRARMLARTGTIWGHNEGAVQKYADFGVTAYTWLATDDDLTCPFCRVMHGQTIPTGSNFWEEGERLNVGLKSGASRGLDFPFKVKHPPLHPNCRCTVVPQLNTTELPALDDVGDLEPIEAIAG